MTYSDFTLESVRKAFDLQFQRAQLFPQATVVDVPSWLTDAWRVVAHLPWVAKKPARS